VGKTAIMVIVIDFDLLTAYPSFLPPTDAVRHRYSARSNYQTNYQFFD